nr:unnamed protein product [Callosobruchus analis]
MSQSSFPVCLTPPPSPAPPPTPAAPALVASGPLTAVAPIKLAGVYVQPKQQVCQSISLTSPFFYSVLLSWALPLVGDELLLEKRHHLFQDAQKWCLRLKETQSL